MATTSTTAQAVADTIREEIDPGIRESLPGIDPVFEDLITSSNRVEKTDNGIGRDWKIKHNFETSLAGAVKFVSPLGGTTLGGGDTQTLNQSIVWGTQQTFPTQSESPGFGTVQVSIPMAKALGNFYMPEDYLKLNVLDAALVNFVAGTLKGVTKRIAHQNAVYFYLPTTGELHTVSSIQSYSGTAAVTYTPDNGRIRWLYNGMAVDVYNQDFSTKRNSNYVLLIDGVDYLNKTCRLVRPDGTAIPAGFVNGDKVVVANCYSSGRIGPYGLDNFLKSSGYLFDSSSGLSVTTYQQFKSLVESLNSTLTDNALSRRMGTFYDAYGINLDTIITSRGVSQGFLEQPAFTKGEFIFNRQGQAVDFKGGWSKVGFVYDGRNYQWLISPYCQEESLYAIKLGDKNLVRYVPPKLRDANTQAKFSTEVEFLSGLGGVSGPFLVARTSGGAASPILEAPFVFRTQFAPKIVQGIKLTNITEAPSIATTTTTTTSSTTTTSTTTAPG